MTDSGPLVVPVAVQAMVLDGANANFIRASMRYGQLATFASPAPAPFQNDPGDGFSTDTANLGVYLMWTLPKALRHGEHQADGSVDFPLVPNRWLVARLHRADGLPPGTAPTVTTWVVESDHLGDPSGSSYVDPHTTSQIAPTLLGRKVPLSASSPWREPSPSAPYFLRAVAESNPAFAAYQPFNENVFSIHDDLAVQQIAAGTISYYVFGWYSQPSADILASWQPDVPKQGFAELVNELRWAASPNGGATSTSSLYQGAAFAIPWHPGHVIPSPKDGVAPQVAVGCGSADGVVAFARAAFEHAEKPPAGLTPQEAVDLLEAFQHNLLPMLGVPGTEAQIEQRIRAEWFGSHEGGTRWTIVDAETPPGQTPPPAPADEELAKEASWLATLNDAQTRLDATMRTLAGTRRELWELWWKQGAADLFARQHGKPPWNTPADALRAAIATRAATVRSLMTELQGLGAQIPLATSTVTLSEAATRYAAAKNLPATRVLKPVSEPRFWSATDPVLVLSNTAHLLRIDPDDALPCRWPSELVSALSVSAAAVGGPTFTVSASQLAPLVPSVAWGGLPTLARALFAELFLLDPASAPQLAAAAGQTLDAAQLAAIAKAMSTLRPADVTGVVPSLLPQGAWGQPWQPLYMDWEIGWYPIPFTRDDGTANWTFDGLDYALTANVPTASTPPRMLAGRSVLTPKPSFEFRSRIEQFMADYPDSPATEELRKVDDLIECIDKWDFLSQRLGGLDALVAGWNPVPAANPGAVPIAGQGTAAELIGDEALMPPNPTSYSSPRGRPAPPSRYEGIRAGQLYVNRLTIVDAFGQTLETVFAPQDGDTVPRTANGGVFQPLLADGVTPTHPIVTDNPQRLVQLPPRLLQPARLDFQLLAGANGNPIVGWVLPNHLDSALSVYGPDGTGYGELRVGVDAAGDSIVVWTPAPGSPHPILPDPSAAVGPLDSFVANLAARGASALSEFLQAIDETLWTVDPLGDRGDAFLSVLIGRPLAIVTASLAYELQTEAWRDPDWPYTLANPRPDPLFVSRAYEFPVRLGDLGYRQDGLIGYFLDGDYTTFNAIHLPATEQPTGYLEKIGPGNYVKLAFAAQGAGAAAALTMLVDPRGAVHAQCGLLPVKDITLPQRWVDEAMAAIVVTFRVGPAVLATRTVVPPGESSPVTTLLLHSPAERTGQWSWVERGGANAWTTMQLAAADGAAELPSTPPTLREGLLSLAGGLSD